MLLRALLISILLLPGTVHAQLRWVEGTHFKTIELKKVANPVPGKIEVAEVFSYGCVHCYQAKDAIRELKAALPADAYMSYVHASFQPTQGWPMLQRAWYTASKLGIGDATHEQMFSSIWETGEMPLIDRTRGTVRSPLPTIEDAARFYARHSTVTATEFLKVANSAEMNNTVFQADGLIAAWRVPGTPAIIVNGRYMIENSSLKSWTELKGLVDHLISLERKRLKMRAPKKS
jgi:protein dithiol oxidoreductase (disulfide-forming)